MDFSKLAACGTGVAAVVSDSNGCIATKWAFHTDCRAYVIIGIGKDFHCRILDKTE